MKFDSNGTSGHVTTWRAVCSKRVKHLDAIGQLKDTAASQHFGGKFNPRPLHTDDNLMNYTTFQPGFFFSVFERVQKYGFNLK